MKVLSGAHSHFDGTIYINGQAASIQTPKDASSYGVQTVHQEVDTALVPYLSVGENMMMHEIEKKNICQLERAASQGGSAIKKKWTSTSPQNDLSAI
ncbi:hypothetical protein BsIDN1_67720 [Bacillus safensis]|uniref:ABC transporter domain-containing protein n=1 Tax=Bacillus safensis TaxID=561879 RepID=A0A5S9MLM1_BACIA|nr:hypothetical protein BsIDN1_67720 [Bacillus safensis]